MFSFWAILLIMLGPVASLPPLTIYQKHFYAIDGTFVPLHGVAYYPRTNAGSLNLPSLDLYTNDFANIWERDLPILASLNTNVIRIYAVDPSQNHDNFMKRCDELGLYVIVELGAPCEHCAITGDAPPTCYPTTLKTRGQFIINTFTRYDNVAGFSAGNEVGTFLSTTTIVVDSLINAPCLKKFIQDMQDYMASCSTLRKVPVGFAMADLDRITKLQYYGCGNQPADWIGINTYLHCNGNDTDPAQLPGYNDLLLDLQELQLPMPLVITEFGCLSDSFPTVNGFPGQRTFVQVATFAMTNFSQELAGNIAFEYSYEVNATVAKNYGLGALVPSDCNDVSIPCTYQPYPQFSFLQEAYSKFDPPHPQPLNRGPLTCNETILKQVDNFDWSETDAVNSLQCPAPTSQAVGAYPFGLWMVVTCVGMIANGL